MIRTLASYERMPVTNQKEYTKKSYLLIFRGKAYEDTPAGGGGLATINIYHYGICHFWSAFSQAEDRF